MNNTIYIYICRRSKISLFPQLIDRPRCQFETDKITEELALIISIDTEGIYC